jgi:hypothetical protein
MKTRLLDRAKKRANRKVSSRRKRSERRGGKSFVGTRKYPLKFRNLPHEVPVVAPERIDFYKHRWQQKTMEFLNELEKTTAAANISGSSVRICFRNTQSISAAAGISLLSTIEVLVAKFPKVEFKIYRPPSTFNEVTKKNINIVHAVLNKIGFYRAINLGTYKTPSFPTVDNWYIGSAFLVEGESLNDAIEKNNFPGLKTNELYRSGIEAMSNATEHAYSDLIPMKKEFPLKKWWIFAGIFNNSLIVLICDKGYGIPVTLPHTQNEALIKRLYDKVKSLIPNVVTSKDSVKIHASTLVKETRTEMGHRGKGGKDIKSFVASHEGAALSVFSNHGFYKHKIKNGKPVDFCYEHRNSIKGTIVEWTIPLNNDSQNEEK